MNLKICYLLSLFAWLTCGELTAELPQLERLVKPIAAELKSQIKEESVAVASRQVGKSPLEWAVHEALSVELATELNREGVHAVPAASDMRLESLGNARVDFTMSDVKRLKGTGYSALVGASLSVADVPRLKLSVLRLEVDAPVWSKEIDVPAEALRLNTNVPDMNRRMIAFCLANFDKKVGDGVCAQLATVGLDSIGAKRSGIYTWGREMDDQEPILPGDVLQLELVEMKSPGFSRGFHHHTAVVEEARPDALVVLHQNVKPKGEIVQRDTWPRASFKSGTMISFRPWLGDSPLHPISPKRRSDATILKRGSSIDLMRTLSPRLDAIKGIWFMEENTLRPNRDDYARLQIPVKVPDKYVLRIKVKRLFGKDQFGVGLVVGGRQTMICLDAYGGTVSGLHLVDGKTVKNNATTHKGAVLPQDKPVNVKIRVVPDAVTADADGKSVVDWKGDSERLSQDEKYAVPRTDWLYLASWNTQFAVSEFLLDELK